MADDMKEKEIDPQAVITEVERTVNEHKNRPRFPERPQPPQPYSQSTIPEDYTETAVAHARKIFDQQKINHVRAMLRGEHGPTGVSTADREIQHSLDAMSVSTRSVDNEKLINQAELNDWANQFGPVIRNFRRPIAEAIDQDLITPPSYSKFAEKLQQRIDKLTRITQEQRRDPLTRMISEGPMITPLSKEVVIEQNGERHVLHREVNLKLEDNQYIYEASETVDGKTVFVSRWVCDADKVKTLHMLPRFTMSVDGEKPNIQNDPRFATATAEAFIKTFDFVTTDQKHWRERLKSVFKRKQRK